MSESMRPDITPEIRAVAEDTFAENLPPSAAELTLDVSWDSDVCHCGEDATHFYDGHSPVPMRDGAQVTARQMGKLIAAVVRALADHHKAAPHSNDTCRFCRTLREALAEIGGRR